MRRPPRGLSADEAALWHRLAATVTPLTPHRPITPFPVHPGEAPASAPVRVKGRVPPPLPAPAAPPPAPRPLDRHGLDGSWDKKLARAGLDPDFTLDLHGHGLDAAHARLDHGLAQAAALGARVVLVIAGKPRPAEAADRGDRRGAIRAKLLDWLAAGPHAARIAAVRPAHRKHGGAGALYIVLRRPR